MKQTIYIPVRFYEREPEDIAVIKFTTYSTTNLSTIMRRLDELILCYETGEKPSEDSDGMLDHIMDELASAFHASDWSYCPTNGSIIIGKVSGS